MEQSIFNRLSLAEQVEDALRREITEGRVHPGERVNPTDYLESWNVSSTPFRDAVKALEMQGFLNVEPRKGVYVSHMNITAFREVFDLRIALESMATELSTPLIPKEKADEALSAYLEAQARLEQGDVEHVMVNDRLVHELAREHCGNQRLQRLLASQWDLIRWAQNTIILQVPESYGLALPEHIAIMRAICARDAAGAADEMRKHLVNARARHEAHLKS